MIIPPFAGVKLVEYRDRIELTPFCWYREIVGLGRRRANEVGPEPGDDMHPFFNAIMGDKEIWVIASWRRYDDGREEPLCISYLDPEATEAEARKRFDAEVKFLEMSKEALEGLAQCFQASKDDLAYMEERFPDVKIGSPSPNAIDDHDLYQARLKVLAGMQPKTVALLKQADTTIDPDEREKIEREVVQAYFAELAHYWTQEVVAAWLSSNPLAPKWWREFIKVLGKPKRELNRFDHELVLNWLRRAYNLLTAQELSDVIFAVTGERKTPPAVKKRRERFGLVTKWKRKLYPGSEQ